MEDQSLNYIPLHLHSDYSIMDGLQSVGAIVKRAAKLKIPALAVTDISNICGYIKFYSACKAAGIKPILGADLPVREQTMPGEPERFFTVTLLAMDRTGRQNLYDIISDAWLRSEAGAFNAHALLEDLAKYSAGLILLNGFRGDIAAMLEKKSQREAEARIAFYQKHFGDRFCFEITRTGRMGETEFENRALDLCLKFGIAPVATNDTRFLYGEEDTGKDGISDYQVHDVRVAIQKGCQRGNKDIARLYSKEQYLKSPAQMRALFADLPEALMNTRAIAERCNVEIELDHPRLPHYPTGDLDAAGCLRQKAEEGLEERLAFLFPDEAEREKQRPVYVDRLNTELKVIIDMDFPGYFLIVMEFIQWSKDHGVPVGPGRGSGGGSLVAYALRITDFDPLRFDLLFERFLNPERVSMPDFDVDFCQRNREKTIEHVKERYGINAVSQIAAFGTMAPKAAIKDAGRALGMGYGAVDYVAKMLPARPGLTFDSAMGIDKKGNPCEPEAPDFVNLYRQAVNDDDKSRVELIHYAMRLEGVIRNIGKHAAGVVISPTRTAEFAPLMLDSDGNPITQFDKKDVEHAGLVKFDFLGLTTLTIIQDALDMVNARKGRRGEPPLDIHAIPYEDPASFKMIQESRTTAVFQLESTGMRKLISQLRPDRFDDLIALVALYRPGPLNSGMVQHFVDRKHGREEVSYPAKEFQDLDLKPILDSTYGVIVYQEQVMQIAQVLAGYSLGGADILRRAMGKKNPAEMAGQRSIFKAGAIKRHKDPDIAMKIFDQVEKFAEYGFNKSHSAAYALVAWWTLWLKTHYPAEFLAAMMTADRQKTEKLVSYIAECRAMNINVTPPDVNLGKFDFCVNDAGEIVYGLGAVKSIGEDLVARVVQERTRGGPFTDLFDFVARVGAQILNRRAVEALIWAGALDSLGGSRAQLHASINLAFQYAQLQNTNQSTGQIDLFAAAAETSVKPKLVPCQPWSDKYRLAQEHNMLGLYLSGHPIDVYLPELLYSGSVPLDRIKSAHGSRPFNVTISGLVTGHTERYSKRDGKKYYIVTLDDSTSQFEFMLFGQYAEAFTQILDERENENAQRSRHSKDPSLQVPPPLVLIVEGALSYNEEHGQRLRVIRLKSLEQHRREKASRLTLKMPAATFNANEELLQKLFMSSSINQNAARGSSGNAGGCRLGLLLDDKYLEFNHSHFLFDPTDLLIDTIRDLAGNDAVTVSYS